MLGHEKRRVRFSSILGIDREDLPLAAEVWQNELCQQIWVSRDIVKLGALFTQYMAEPHPRFMTPGYLERAYHMDIAMLRDALRQMKVYGAVEAFMVEDSAIRVSLRLSLMQRLRVLELRNRFLELSSVTSMRELHQVDAPDQWVPPEPEVMAEMAADGVSEGAAGGAVRQAAGGNTASGLRQRLQALGSA